jgi:hypothetical protein
MPQVADQPAPPLRTWRPMAAWTAGILLALGLVWFVGALALPYVHVRAFMVRGDGPSPEQVRRLGGPEKAGRKIVWYLWLPKALAPRLSKGSDEWGWVAYLQNNLGQHGVPCLIQLIRDDRPGRQVWVYMLGQFLLELVQKTELENVEPDIEPRVFDAGVLAITGALDDDRAEVRLTAATVLGYLGPRATAAVPALERVSRDSGDGEMRRAVAAVLTKIRGEEAKP